jgi:hypothetical protein
MANCSNLFKTFCTSITLNDARVKGLKGSRTSLRKRVRTYFLENKPDEIQPKFESQGSIVHETATNPIPYKKTIKGKEYTFVEYDVDDGIYFIGLLEDRKSVATYHKWIMDAVEGQTSTFDPEDKTTCVRVLYSDGHHIDLPIYFKEEGEGIVPTLAHKIKGWIDADPLAFTNWLKKKTDDKPQILRLIKYMKAWKVYRESCRSDKSFPSGFLLSVLVCNHYIENDRDDISFKETLSNMHTKLNAYNGFNCYRPTTPTDEDLLASYSHKDYFLEQLKGLVDGGTIALKTSNQKESCEKWQSFFGSRFNCTTAKDEDEKKSVSPAFVGTAAKSRPWSC